MTALASTIDIESQSTGRRPASKGAERRRHQRLKVNLLGRYMLSDRQEYPCQVVDMSPGGVALIAPVKGTEGERVVCYLDHLGRIEGVIARTMDNGFAIRITVPLIKREKLADQLTWIANRNDLGMPEDRRHDRIPPKMARSTMTGADSASFPVRIIDMSISGAAVTCDVKPAVGSAVTIGKTPARVVRVSAVGFAVEFLRLIPVETFDEYYEL